MLYCCCSVTQSCLTLCDPMPGFPVLHYLPEFACTHVYWVSDAIYNHLILCHPLLLHKIIPSTRVFSDELALHIRWPKYWSFSFSTSPSKEYSGFISFRIDWFDLVAVQGTLRSLFQHHFQNIGSLVLSFLYSLNSHPYVTTGKTIASAS